MAQDFSLRYELVMSDRIWEELRKHLFPGASWILIAWTQPALHGSWEVHHGMQLLDCQGESAHRGSGVSLPD